MKLYVWYSPSTSVTGRALARELGLTRTSHKSWDRGYGTLIPPHGTTHVVCWGGREPLRRKEFRERNLRRRHVLNNPFEIDQYKDKLKALIKMERGGVSVPKFNWYKQRDILDRGLLNYPLIGRTRYHYGGSGFKFIRNEEELQKDYQSDYWLEYIDGEDKREYRVHVFRGEILRVQRKREKEEYDHVKLHNVCRSHNNGWYFSLCDIERTHESVKREAINAVRSLGYDFGAVDVIRIPSQDKTVVLEVNSGCGLDNSGLELYAQKIKEWIEVTRNDNNKRL